MLITKITQAISSFNKRASEFIAYCKDQGIPYIMASSAPSSAIQYSTYTMAAGGVVTFATLGLQNMADANYIVLTSKATGATATACATGTRTTTAFTITGPTNGDVVDFAVVGKLSGMI